MSIPWNQVSDGDYVLLQAVTSRPFCTPVGCRFWTRQKRDLFWTSTPVVDCWDLLPSLTHLPDKPMKRMMGHYAVLARLPSNGSHLPSLEEFKAAEAAAIETP